MASLQEKLALSLKELQILQNEDGFAVVQSTELTRTHLQRLVSNGFLQEVIKGWYISARPDRFVGDTTTWNASCWFFIRKYANKRFGTKWCLSPEQSLSFHGGDDLIPSQILIRTDRKTSNVVELLQNTSLMYYHAKIANPLQFDHRYGINIYSLDEALVECSPHYFQNCSINARICLSMIGDISDILKRLLSSGSSTKAARLAGAFRAVGNVSGADEIIGTMKRYGYDVRETNPFLGDDYGLPSFSAICHSPYRMRLQLLWNKMRPSVIKVFPKESGLPKNSNECINKIEKQYKTDAYNSLSIEGFQVSDELIKKVQSGSWNPNANDIDAGLINALAAKGYWLAYQSVVSSIKRTLSGEDAAGVFETDLSIWYQALFAPHVSAGLLSPSDTIGYRSSQVYINGSHHTPLSQGAVREAMPVLFELLKGEPSAAVRGVLGHFMFVYIHPYMDGNGRIARFLLNMQLVSGGYSWVTVPVERRQDYLNALERASVDSEISEFAEFIQSLNV
ncbi:MAG: Fic family protein [Clostridiales Family XIII bacterium]|jgi:hypothetical protein|nr:Fic family protein [Clostridiales Family XIII bacterium]